MGQIIFWRSRPRRVTHGADVWSTHPNLILGALSTRPQTGRMRFPPASRASVEGYCLVASDDLPESVSVAIRSCPSFVHLLDGIRWMAGDSADSCSLLPGRIAIESTQWTLGATLSRWEHGFEPRWDCLVSPLVRGHFGGSLTMEISAARPPCALPSGEEPPDGCRVSRHT
jgi:hypothetical protein